MVAVEVQDHLIMVLVVQKHQEDLAVVEMVEEAQMVEQMELQGQQTLAVEVVEVNI